MFIPKEIHKLIGIIGIKYNKFILLENNDTRYYYSYNTDYIDITINSDGILYEIFIIQNFKANNIRSNNIEEHINFIKKRYKKEYKEYVLEQRKTTIKKILNV